MTDSNRRFVLAERPAGAVDDNTVRLEEGPVPTAGPGEALVKVRYLSIDPTIRTWMDDVRGYLPPIAIGEVIRGAGVGEVVASKSPRYNVAAWSSACSDGRTTPSSTRRGAGRSRSWPGSTRRLR